MDEVLHREYYQILPMGGIVLNTPVGSRTVDTGFFGVGLPHLGVEALIADVKQTTNALRESNGGGKTHADILLIAIPRVRPMVSPTPGVLRSV